MDKTLQTITDSEITPQGKNTLWRHYHSIILGAIESIIDEGRMPTPTEIATIANVSRPTVYEHLKHINYHNTSDEIIQLRRQRLLERLYGHATGSWHIDSTPASTLKAIELYLKYTDPGSTHQSGKTVNIQINTEGV